MAIATSMNYFQLTNKIAASGNIMFLVDSDGELRDLTDFDDGGLGFVF